MQRLFGIVFTGAGGGISVANICHHIQPVIGVFGGIIMLIGGVVLISVNRQKLQVHRLEALLKQEQLRQLKNEQLQH